MKRASIASGVFRLCAALVIAMLPLQIGFAQTYYYENTTDYDSELYLHESSDSNTSSWHSRWEQQTKNKNGDVEVKTTYSSSGDPSDWRERWSSRSKTDKNKEVNSRQTTTQSNWRDRWEQSGKRSMNWGNTINEDIDDFRDDLENDIDDFRDEMERDRSDWRTRWAQTTSKWRDDWGNNNNDDDDDPDDNETTRAEAVAAINQAEDAIDEFEEMIETMEDDGADEDDIDEAQRVLAAARTELNKARTQFQKRDYERAVTAAEKVEDILDQYEESPNDDDDGDIPESCMVSDAQLDRVTNFPPQNDGPIVAFGDSLTAGVGATSGQDYVSELERLIGEDIVNAGVRGDTTEEALDRLEEDVLSHDPRAVIVWLGGNDILARYFDEIEERAEDDSIWEDIYEAVLRLFGREPNNDEVLTENETFRNIETIVERIQDTGAVVILIGIDGEPLDNNLSARYREVAEDTGAIFVNDVLRGIIGRSSLTSDFIHPNNAGYELVAERIFPAVACIAEEIDSDDDDNDRNYRNTTTRTGNDRSPSDWRERWGST